MPPWKELKFPFRNGMINAFNLNSLEAMLTLQCVGSSLEELTDRDANLL